MRTQRQGSVLEPFDFSEFRLLRHEDLKLCIAQTRPPEEADAFNDRNRPAAVQVIANLLPPQQGGLGDYCTDPLVMLLPEYAFGSGDWGAVDCLVRRCEIPLVLIVGFGATKGSWMINWVNETDEGGTIRRLGHHPNIARANQYAGGWCWVREPNRTTCITFLKNHLEPRGERLAINGRGAQIVSLRFADLTLFPLLCADLICEEPNNPVDRIAEAIKTCDGPVLVTGSLWQEPLHHSGWGRAIDRLFAILDPMRTILALANHAVDEFKEEEAKDAFRSFSGVLATRDSFPAISCSNRALRVLTAPPPSYSGSMVRRTVPCATLIALHWPTGRFGTGRHLALGEQVFLIDPGTQALTLCAENETHAYELIRFLRRHQPNPAPSDLQNGLHRVIDGIGASFKAELLHSTILHGINGLPPVVGLGHDDLHTQKDFLEPGLLGLSCLFGSDRVNWQEQAELHGQALITNQRNIHLLVWKDNKKSKQTMEREVQLWQLNNPVHPPLIIVNQSHRNSAMTGQITQADGVAGNIEPDRLTDISSPPLPRDAKDITQAHRWPKVFGVNLGEVREALEEGQGADALIANLEAHLA